MLGVRSTDASTVRPRTDRRIPILLAAIGVLLGAWTGWRPARLVEAAPLVDVAPTPSDDPAAAPCPPVGGLARPRSARVDPELDPELGGSPIPWPADVDPRWLPEALAKILSGPGVTLHCEE